MGQADVGTGINTKVHAFLFDDGAICVTLVRFNGSESVAYDINDSGQVVGYATNGGNAQRAFLFNNGIMQDLGNLGAALGSLANGINELGQVVLVLPARATVTPCVFSTAVGRCEDLGTLGGNNSVAYGVNASGQVIGDSLYPGGGLSNHSFLYSNGIMSDLNNLFWIARAQIGPSFTPMELTTQALIVEVGTCSKRSNSCLFINTCT